MESIIAIEKRGVKKIKMKKLLVTGISGFLGSCLATLNPEEWNIYGLYNSNPVKDSNIISIKINLSDSLELKKIFHKIQPDAVLHMAAISNPNFCETNQEISKKINVDVSLELVKLCQISSIPFLFTSTDLVFDGQEGPYDETSIPEPVSIYGKQKALAEKLILEHYPEACIVRCPVMYGLSKWGNSFMNSWLENLKKEQQVFAFTDEYRTKVSGKSAVEGMLLLLNKNASGIWHLGGRERISRYDFAIQMAQVFQLPEDLVQASLQADVKMAAARPADVSLNSTKAFEIGYNPKSIDEDLKEYAMKNK